MTPAQPLVNPQKCRSPSVSPCQNPRSPRHHYPQAPDRTYGGLVSSIQAVGVTEAVILRQREDGEYQLLAGYRRRRASELAKQQDIPAYVYEMTMQEALAYHQRQKSQPDAPVPGKLLSPPIPAESTVLKQGETKAADRKKPETLTPTASTTPKQAEVKATDGKKLETRPAASTVPKQTDTKATDGEKAGRPRPCDLHHSQTGRGQGYRQGRSWRPGPCDLHRPQTGRGRGRRWEENEGPGPCGLHHSQTGRGQGADGKKLETPAPTASTTPKQAEAKATDGKKLEALAPAASTVPKQADTRAPGGEENGGPGLCDRHHA